MFNLSFSFISFNYYTHSCEITGIFPFIFFHIVLSTVFFNSNIFFNLQIFCFYILTYSTILSFLYSYVLYNLEFALTGCLVRAPQIRPIKINYGRGKGPCPYQNQKKINIKNRQRQKTRSRDQYI